MRVDQADHESVVRLKDEIKNKFGKLDVFVNNAVSRPMVGYNAPIEQFADSMRVNATGMTDILREMADLIAQSGGGSIINVSSMMGMFGPDLSNYEGTDMGDMPPDYFFHRGGMINLKCFLTRMLADKNIRVNCISPGGLFDNQPERFVENYCKKVPVKRMANDDDFFLYFENIGTKYKYKFIDGKVLYQKNKPIRMVSRATIHSTAIDWNRDGIPDLLVGTETGVFYYWERLANSMTTTMTTVGNQTPAKYPYFKK